MAWFGMKKDPEGKLVSAGCFQQGFFTNEANLKKWVERIPRRPARRSPSNRRWPKDGADAPADQQGL